jgi:hypothetical protein
VDPRTGLDNIEKRTFLILPGLELRLLSVVQHITSPCTDELLEEKRRTKEFKDEVVNEK